MTHASERPHHTPGADTHTFSRQGYLSAHVHDLSTDDVDGAKVYGRDDDSVGSISSLKLGPDGKLTHAVIDVGGFLGMGTHPVAVPFSSLVVLREKDGSDVRVYLNATEDQLKAMPKYEN
ncbi:PRC-barrel domain-containing protein [Glycocaulis sp.]|uniref:PRC-barrel domain-containing protein n=1 Tax=Glycocaulis sp. TaxID=1969725 RepID=UPI003F72A67E